MYLAILLLLIIYYLFSNRKDIFVIATVSLLLLNELYYYINYNRIERFSSSIDSYTFDIRKDFDRDVKVSKSSSSSSASVDAKQLVSPFAPLENSNSLMSFVYGNNYLLGFGNQLSKGNMVYAFNENFDVGFKQELTDNTLTGVSSVKFKEYLIIVANGIAYIFNTIWQVTTPISLTKPRDHCTCGIHKNKVFIAFGINEDNKVSTKIDVYDHSITGNPLDKNSWSVISCPFKPETHMTAYSTDKSIIFVGKEKMILFDVEEEDWNEKDIPKKMLNQKTAQVKDKIYFLDSFKQQSFYNNTDIILTILDKPYNVSSEDGEIKYEDADIDEFENLFDDIDQKYDFNTINYFYLTNKIESLYNKISDDSKNTITLWIHIDPRNKGKTKIIIGKKTNYIGIAIHKDKLCPCFFLKDKILIKYDETNPDIIYDKWTMLTFNLEKYNDKANTSVFVSYNGVHHTISMNFKITFNQPIKGLLLNGFENFNSDLGYVDYSKGANLKLFNKNIDLWTLNDIFYFERVSYESAFTPVLHYYDLTENQFKHSDLYMEKNLTYGNICSVNNIYLCLGFKENIKILDTFNNNIESYKHDVNTEGLIHNMIDRENGLILVSYVNSIIKFKFIPIETPVEYVDKSLKCPPGYGLKNGLCEICDIDTYSNVNDKSPCKKCPKTMSTNGEYGSRFCKPTQEFLDRKVFKTLSKDQTIILKKRQDQNQKIYSKIEANRNDIKNLSYNLDINM